MAGISSYGMYGKYNSFSGIGSYGSFASGKKINSAKDGASELAMATKMDRQYRGLEAGSQGITMGQNMVNVAEGGMAGISDMLQRMRELGVKALNDAVNGPDEIKAIQDEISQLKQGISDTVNATTFNEKKLLDGSMESGVRIGTGADAGVGVEITPGNSTLRSLGIEDYGVNGNFDLNAIDAAIKKVSGSRSTLGAQYNRMTYSFNGNNITGLNTLSAKSSLEDLDVPKAISDIKKKQLLDQYRTYSQRMFMDNKRNNILALFKK